MPNIAKALRRDSKHRKNKYGMRVDNRNIFQIESAKKKRDMEWRKRRKEKEDLLDNIT